MKITDEWLYEQMPKVEKAILDEIPDQPELPFQPSAKFEKRMKRLIRQSRHPRMHFRYMKKTGRIAAVVVLGAVITGAATFGVKATEPMRMEIMDQTWHEDYVEEHYHVTGEGRVKYLTYIPEGYELVEEDKDAYWAEYQNASGDKIEYNVWVLSDGASVTRDTEFERVEYVELRGTTIEIGYKDTGWINCSWKEDNALYFLGADNLEKEELIEMISGIE